MKKDWWPTKELYDPGLTKEDWLSIINDREMCQEKWLHILARFYEYGGEGACSAIEDYYDEQPKSYNMYMQFFGKKLISAGKCQMMSGIDDRNRYWPVPFIGRDAEKSEPGVFVWKLRAELKAALTEFDVVSWDQDYLLRELVNRYKTLIEKTNYTEFIDEEIYKWQYITDNTNASPLEIITYLIKNNMNIYDRVRDSQSWTTLKKDNPKGLEKTIIRLKDESVSLHKRLSDYKAEMKELFDGYSFNSYANDERTAACFLSCWYPQTYTLYKDGDLYEPLCLYLGVKKKTAGSKYEHFLEIARHLAGIIQNDEDLQKVFKEKTKGYVQSDILIAQTVIWCVFSRQGQERLFGKTRQYWSGGIFWGTENKTHQFISGDYWQIGWKDKTATNGAKQAWSNIEKVKIGDYLAFHSYGGQNDLTIHYLAEVVEKDTENGILNIKKLPVDKYYKGKAPKMKKGTWFGTLIPVTGQNAINTIFQVEEEASKMIPEKIVEFGSIICSKKNVILQGAPGTGKTYSTAALALYVIGQKEPNAIEGLDFNDHTQVMERYEDFRKKDQIEFCTFHQSMDYEDFVEGLRPELKDNGTTVTYRVKPGIFKRICGNAAKDKNYVLIIDEINRGYVSKIFGELITLLEKDKRIGAEHQINVKLPYSNEDFGVPSNLFIIGTMNTTDRTTGTLDYALRRRFDFITLESDPSVLDSFVAEARIIFDDVKKFIQDKKLDDMDISDLMVGHSYFMAKDLDELKNRVCYEVIPLVKEYIKDGILNCLPGEANDYFEDWKKLVPHNKGNQEVIE